MSDYVSFSGSSSAPSLSRFLARRFHLAGHDPCPAPGVQLCLRCPEESFEFLGYRIGRNYRPNGKGAYIGTRPSKASVQGICRKMSELTRPRYGYLPVGEIVNRLNRAMSGWANYFHLGQVAPAYKAVDKHATRRLHQWLCRKHGTKSRKYVHFSDERLGKLHGLHYLALKTKGLPWAKA